MNNNQLADLTFDDRLDIVAHGNPYGPVSIGNIDIETSISPRGLVEQLKAQGLRQVGVLKLQSCNVGGGFYLPALSSELQRAGIDVGFISAPKGYLVQLPGLPRAVFDPFPTFSSDRYEIISTGLHQGFQEPDTLTINRHKNKNSKIVIHFAVFTHPLDQCLS